MFSWKTSDVDLSRLIRFIARTQHALTGALALALDTTVFFHSGYPHYPISKGVNISLSPQIPEKIGQVLSLWGARMVTEALQSLKPRENFCGSPWLFNRLLWTIAHSWMIYSDLS